MSSSLVVIVGPTASGKSDFALKVAKKFNGEIICADSRTIYKGMDVGTAKPSKDDRAEVKHHLLDVVAPDEPFSVSDFKRLANRAINDIHARGKLPIMVGGSGLYVDSVIFDYEFGPPADAGARNELASKSVEELQNICIQNNIQLPENSRNKRYLVRAIEAGGVINRPKKLRSETIVVGIATNKEDLGRRIQKRANKMLEQGILSEVTSLGAKYGWQSEAMKGNIYRVFRSVVEGEVSIDEAVKEVVASDKKLVKKQLTWFRRNQHIVWGKTTDLMTVIEQFIKSTKDPSTT